MQTTKKILLLLCAIAIAIVNPALVVAQSVSGQCEGTYLGEGIFVVGSEELITKIANGRPLDGFHDTPSELRNYVDRGEYPYLNEFLIRCGKLDNAGKLDSDLVKFGLIMGIKESLPHEITHRFWYQISEFRAYFDQVWALLPNNKKQEFYNSLINTGGYTPEVLLKGGTVAAPKGFLVEELAAFTISLSRFNFDQTRMFFKGNASRNNIAEVIEFKTNLGSIKFDKKTFTFTISLLNTSGDVIHKAALDFSDLVNLRDGEIIPQSTNSPTTPPANTSTANDMPKYEGVDTSIREFLCAPSEPADGHDLERCVNKLYRFGISFGAIALVFFIVFAGYMYMTGGETGKVKAKGILQNALIGMGILLFSYVLLSFVNPSLVLIKPIQPPIFTATDLPSCEAVGFSKDCVLPSSNGQSGGGGKSIIPPCTEGLVTVASLGVKDFRGGLKVCKPLGEKLAAAYKNRGTVDWGITATIDNGHTSDCHTPGDPKAGNCADIGIAGNPAAADLWDKVCAVLKAQGLTSIGNESNVTTASCGAAVDKSKPPYTKASASPSLHVNYTVGGGGSTIAGGSRPYCITHDKFKFLCKNPISGTWPGYNANKKMATTGHDKATQDNIDKIVGIVKAAGKDSQIKQLYRSPEYGAYRRSVYEAWWLIKNRSESELVKTGAYCTGSIQYVKKSDVANLSTADINSIKALAQAVMGNQFENWSAFNTTCDSDHGYGYAVDIGNGNPVLRISGLCHNLKNGLFKQDRDNGHYVLTEKNRTGAGCE